MYRCHACAAAFVSPTPTAEQLARYYNSYHLDDEHGGVYDSVEARMQSDFPAKLSLLKRHAPAGARLIDVGCGKGFFVKAAADAGIDAQGVDLSESGVAYATGTLKVRATAGLLADLKPTLGAFDAATFWATIEHLPDPIATMRDIRDVLKPGGLLLLDTGIGHDWLDRTLPGRTQWYDPPQHLFVFSRRGMEIALDKAGFSIVHFDPCFDRSAGRRFARKLRNTALALGLRTAAALGRLRHSPFCFTRYPVGNLMSVVARRRD